MGSVLSGDPDLLLRLARLARLELGSEAARYARDIAEIIAYVERVQQVPVSHQPRTSTITGVQHVLREDTSAPSELAEALLQCAPETARRLVKVPAVL